MSKDFFDVSFCKDTKAIYLGQFPNTIDGFAEVILLLGSQTTAPLSEWFVCFENTGIYSKSLLEWLISQRVACKEEVPVKISRSLGLRRGKSDKVDSKDICIYAFEKRDSIEPSVLSKPLIVKLKKLLSQRDLLIRQKVALKLSLKGQELFLDPEFFSILNLGNQEIISGYKDQISKIESMIEELLSLDEQAKINHGLAQSVIGIGPINSAFIIAYTENYTRLIDARKFASYAGIAPFPNQSGNRRGRNKVSHMANKKLKSLLSQAVLAAIQYDPQLKEYYHRKKSQGKEFGVIANAIKNKLVQRVFCVINRQSPYVKLNAYA